MEALEQRGRQVSDGEAAAVFFRLAAQRDRLWKRSHSAESGANKWGWPERSWLGSG